MAQVYRIMLRCPVTGGAFDTGIRSSGRDALTSSIYRDGTANCPLCGELHPFEANAFSEPGPDVLRDDIWRPNP